MNTNTTQMHDGGKKVLMIVAAVIVILLLAFIVLQNRNAFKTNEGLSDKERQQVLTEIKTNAEANPSTMTSVSRKNILNSMFSAHK